MKINLTIPKKWNDLTKKQLLFVARLYLLKLTQNSFRMRVFCYLTGIRARGEKKIEEDWYYVFSKKRKRFLIHEQELIYFLKSVDYLIQGSQLTKQNFPVFRILFSQFFGPSNSGYNITWLEFINAEGCFYAFSKTQNQKYLDQLCAVLYRPQKISYDPVAEDFTGDRRQRFNDFTYQRRAWYFRFITPVKKMCIFMFYVGFRNKLVEKNPYCFSAEVVSSEPVNPVEGLMATMRTLNMDDITKNSSIQHSSVWEAFAQLNDMIKNIKEHNTHGKI